MSKNQEIANEIFEIVDRAVESTTRISDDILEFANENAIDLKKIKVEEVVNALTPKLQQFIRESVEMAIELKEFIDEE
jgi:uncharacterized protein Yka (UPF0111/DUF47 family)